MTGVSRSVSEPRVRRRGVSLGAVAGLVVLAAIAGLLLAGFAGSDDPPAPPAATLPQPTTHDGIRVQIPRGWARGTVAGVRGFDHPLGLHHADAGLRALVERLPATSATLLPAAFLKTLVHAPERPAVVRVGTGQQAWRYRFPGRDGSMTLFYAAPTTGGIATVACTSPLDTSIPRECDALAAAVTVPGSRPLEPGASAAFFSRLPSVVSELDSARGKGLADLRAATRARGQALAAGALARAHKTAGATLAPLAGMRDGAPSATAGALAAAGAAYGALSSAARARSPQPYADARRAVSSAETDLDRSMKKTTAALSAATHGAERSANAPVRTPVTEKRPATPRTTPAAAPKKPAAAEKKPAAAKTPSIGHVVVEAPAKARPAATAAGGADLTLLILALAGVIAVIFAVRGATRGVR